MDNFEYTAYQNLTWENAYSTTSCCVMLCFSITFYCTFYLHSQNEMDKVHPLGCVVSLGTGRVPEVQVDHVDVFRPENIFDAAKAVKGASTLGYLLVDQVHDTITPSTVNKKATYLMCSLHLM